MSRLLACVICIFLSSLLSLAGEGKQSHSVIRAGCEYDYPPYCLVSPEGVAQGFSVELLRAALQHMGRDVQFHTASWNELKKDLAQGKIEVLPLMARTPKREALYDFTFPYLSMFGTVVVREETTDIKSFDDLKGKRIAVMKGDSIAEFLQSFKLPATITETDTFRTALQELSEGKQDAVVIQQTVFRHLQKLFGFNNLTAVGGAMPEYRQQFCFAVKKGNYPLLSVLNEGLAFASSSEIYRDLYAKWLAPELSGVRFESKVVVGGNNCFPPYSYIDSSGKPAGYLVELVKTIARNSDLDIEIDLSPWPVLLQRLKDGDIDLVDGIFFSPGRTRDFVFSQAVCAVNEIILARKGTYMPKGLSELRGKRVLVQNKSANHEFIGQGGYGTVVVPVPLHQDAIQKLSAGEGDYAVVPQMLAQYFILKLDIENIELGPVVSTSEFCFASQRVNSALLSRFSEGLIGLEKSGELHQIRKKSLSPYDTQHVSGMLLTKYIAVIVGPLLLLLLGILLWSKQLKARVGKATAALEEQGKRLQIATTSAGIGIWDWNLVDDHMVLDEQTKKIYGLTRVPHPCGVSLWKDLLFPEDLDRVWNECQAALRGEKDYDVEFRIKVPGVGVRYVKASGLVIRNSAGEAVRMLGINYEITERRKAEETLRKDEAHLRNILQTAMDGFLIVQLDGRVVDVNSAYCAMTGYTREEILNMELAELVAEDLEDESLSHTRVTAENTRKRFESKHRRKDGSIIDVEVSVIYDPMDGGRYVSFVHDISQLKRNEQMLRKRLVALTRPLEHSEEIVFEDIFNLDDIQRLQDQFAAATGVASIITHVDGTPITKPSNFCRLCSEIIRKSPKGCANCYKSDAVLGRLKVDGPSIQPCLSGGLWDAGAAITVGGRHLANWLIGQVRDETQTDEKMRKYAHEIEVDEEEVLAAFHEVPAMAIDQFRLVSKALFTLANQLSDTAYQNVQQARFISDKLQAEDALRSNEEKYRTIFNAPSEAIIIHDADTGKILDVNDAALSMFGYSSKDELQAVGFKDLSANEAKYNNARALAFIHEAALVGETRFDWESRKKDGTCFFTEIVLTRIEINNTSRVLAVVRDITERKNSEEALRQSEEKFRAVVQSTPSAMVFYHLDEDDQLILTGANPAADKILNAFERKLIGQKIEDAFENVTPENMQMYKDVALRKIDSQCYEAYYADGFFSGTFYTHVFATLDRQIAVNFVDVSEQRRAEEVQRILYAALENSTDAIGMSTADGHHYYQNKAFEVLFGQAGDCPPDTIYCNKDEGERIFRILMSGHDWTGEVLMFDRNHNVRNILLRAYANKDKNGKIISLVGVHTDITESKQMEERLQHVQKMDAIGKLAGGVAHDFNNQLGGIMGLSELLLLRLKDPELRGFASSIITAATRAADVTSKLLAFARKGQYQSVPVDIHYVIHEVADILSHSIDKKITIRKILVADPPTTMGDPSQLQNALLNLAINSRDAMPEGGVLTFETAIDHLDLDYCNRMTYEIHPGEYIRVDVTDTGCGIASEILGRVYEPFFTTKDVGKGTGMGLAAVYGTIKQHKGAIDVFSEVGKGTTFRLYLPLETQNTIAEKTVPETSSAVKAAKILLIDDEDIIRQVATQMLDDLGYEAVGCENGRVGVDYYKEHWREIDLVILDMIMPEMNGQDTYEEFKTINPKVKVLISSGFSIDGAAQAMIDSGVLGFIQKPFRQSMLSECVADALKAADKDLS